MEDLELEKKNNELENSNKNLREELAFCKNALENLGLHIVELCGQKTILADKVSYKEALAENEALKDSIAIVLAQKKNIWERYNELEKNSKKLENRLFKKIERLEKKFQNVKEDVKFYEKVLKRNGFIIDGAFIFKKENIRNQNKKS